MFGSVDVGGERRIRIAPRAGLGTEQAATAARLFNVTGRRRGSVPDCLIAAAAITEEAELATEDREDFQRLTGHGLKLAPVPRTG